MAKKLIYFVRKMMGSRQPRMTVFSQNFLGGVQTFYYNLLANTPDDFFDIRWFLLDIKGHTFVKPPAPFGLGEVVIKYDDHIGRWRNAKNISKNIPNSDGVVLVNHHYELDALLLYPKPNTAIFHLVHDRGYLNFSKSYHNIIDVFLTHNTELYEELLNILPKRRNDIFFLPYGIKLSEINREKNFSRSLRIAFIGRVCTDKGVFDMPIIDNRLKAQGIDVEWLIIGNGPEIKEFKLAVDGRENFAHRIFDTTDEIFQAIATCDVYLLPSVLDGTPVSLLESMSVGLVPILYRFNNGIQNVVTEDIGYITDVGDINNVVSIITKLHKDRNLLETKSLAAIASAKSNFDAKVRAADYFELFKRFKEFKRNKGSISRPKPNILNNPLVPIKIADYYLKVKKILFS
jgi:glycosyltransferase involved in cell wall biosynthesis